MEEEKKTVEMAPEAHAMTGETPKTPAQKKMLSVLLAGLGVALVAGLIVWYVVGIQSVKKLSESSFAVTTAQIFRIPVASINGDRIPYEEYVDNLQAMRTFYDTDTTGMQRP